MHDLENPLFALGSTKFLCVLCSDNLLRPSSTLLLKTSKCRPVTQKLVSIFCVCALVVRMSHTKEPTKGKMLARTLILSVLLLAGAGAFLAPHQRARPGRAFFPVRNLLENEPKRVDPPNVRLTTTTTTTLLEAKKNTKKSPAGSEEKESPSALTMLIAYMTPWRNPNSIFVYMLLTLYALGKYSESQHGP